MKNYFLLIVSILLLFSGCNKYKEGAFDVYQAPKILNFYFAKTALALSDSVQKTGRLCYVESGITKIVSDLDMGQVNSGNETYRWFSTMEVALLSADKQMDNYFMAFSDGTKINMVIQTRRYSQSDALNHPCRCSYPLIKFQCNGKDAVVDANVKTATTYRLE